MAHVSGFRGYVRDSDVVVILWLYVHFTTNLIIRKIISIGLHLSEKFSSGMIYSKQANK